MPRMTATASAVMRPKSAADSDEVTSMWKTRQGDRALNVTLERERTSAFRKRATAKPTAATMKIGRTSLAKMDSSRVTGQ
jgi:hypothetical protein